MDPQATHNLAVSVVLLVSMTVTAWAGGWLVVAIEAACAVAWRCYRGRAD